MLDLRNVIVFTIGASRYAVDLRWVKEVVSLGFVTGIPTAPPALGGVCNLHGTILPVLDVGPLLGGEPGLPARQGDGALVIETGGVVCAFRVDQVDHVGSLKHTGGAIVDASGRTLTLIEPEKLVKQALEAVTGAGVVPA